MRYALAALMCLSATALTLAQQAPQTTPAPSIGLPLPSIGLPLPPIGLDTSVVQPDRSVDLDPPASGGPRHFRPPAIVIFGAPYGFGVDPALQSARPGMIAPSAPPAAPEPLTGLLRIDIEPADVSQIFVDGEYVGMPHDLNGELELAPGRRQIEIRAPGFETLLFDVRIVAGRTISYRGTLQPVTSGRSSSTPQRPSGGTSPGTGTRAPTAPPGSSGTFYLIPGCYLGNVHPDQVKLPDGCDLSRMITHTPS